MTTTNGTSRSHHTRDRPTSSPTPATAPTAEMATGNGPATTETSRIDDNSMANVLLELLSRPAENSPEKSVKPLPMFPEQEGRR